MMYRYDLHIHTAECDLAAHVPAAEIVRMYHDEGYNGLIITDHCFSIFFDWFGEELAGKSHKEITERWLRGYYEARNEGEKLGITVLPGAEVRFDGTINDYLVYGLTEEFLCAHPSILDYTVEEFHEIAKGNGLLLVQAHPYRDNPHNYTTPHRQHQHLAGNPSDALFVTATHRLGNHRQCGNAKCRTNTAHKPGYGGGHADCCRSIFP